ncbi:MAG: 30S ribosomal protein S15 [Elusimicrobia bacterium RIFOXYA2_FULL_39_19]|nr:MAG: 30S ribosomal protein S15 [Elusimicrobia bacterium RIFOXYA2_FULL_39_19]
MLKKDVKKQIIESFKSHKADTGSTSVQIAILTEQITQLNAHFKASPKDYTSRRGFLKMIGRRRRLLAYLKRSNPAEFKQITTKLGIG